MQSAQKIIISSRDEVNQYLKIKGKCELEVIGTEGEMNVTIYKAKTEAEQKAKPYKEKIKLIEKAIADFAERNKHEIEGKTKEMTFGRVGFRLASSIVVSKNKADKIIESLKKFGMENCIKVTETLNKDVLATYSDKDIAKVGALRKVQDKFWCEADKEKIAG